MTLHLIRHTRVNVAPGICYGQTDVALQASFPEEAVAVQAKLEGVHLTHGFSSPLTRCRRLAERLVPAALPLAYDDRLKELNFGHWEGRPWCEFEQTPEARLWFDDYLHTPCPGGESYQALLARIQAFLDDLKSLPDAASVLIVSHGGPIRALLVCLGMAAPEKLFDIQVDCGTVKMIACEAFPGRIPV